MSTALEALQSIWAVVSDAETNHNGHISKNQRLAIMYWCAVGLGIIEERKSKPKKEAIVLPFPKNEETQK